MTRTFWFMVFNNLINLYFPGRRLWCALRVINKKNKNKIINKKKKDDPANTCYVYHAGHVRKNKNSKNKKHKQY